MTREELGDAAVTLGIAAVVGTVVLAVALPAAALAALADALGLVVDRRRPERAVMTWQEPETLQGHRQ